MPTKQKQKKILCVKLGAIGDVLLTTPALQLLTKQEKEKSLIVHYLVGGWSASVLNNNPHINKLIVVDETIFYRKNIVSLIALVRLLLRLAYHRYDTVVLWHRNILYTYYFNALKILNVFKTKIITFRQKKFLGKSQDNFIDGKHHANNFADLLLSTHLVDAKSKIVNKLHFHVLEEHPQKKWQVSDWFKHYNINTSLHNKTVIVLNPGGGTNPGETVTVRRWSTDNYVKLLIERIQAHSFVKNNDEVYLLVGGKDDANLCDTIINKVLFKQAKLSYSDSLHNLAGKSKLEDFYLFLCALANNKQIARAIYITGDTGGMHIAAASGIKTVALFGPTDPREKMPFMAENKFKILQANLSCLPCYRGRFKGCHHPICMDGIAVTDVHKAIDSL